MKKTLLFALLFIIAISAGSCGSDDSTPISIAPPSTEALTFKLNGVYKAFENVKVGGRVLGDGTSSRSVTAIEKGKPSNKLSFKIVQTHDDDKTVLQLFKYTENDEEVFYNFQASSYIWWYDLHALRGTFTSTSGENEVRDGTLNLSF